MMRGYSASIGSGHSMPDAAATVSGVSFHHRTGFDGYSAAELARTLLEPSVHVYVDGGANEFEPGYVHVDSAISSGLPFAGTPRPGWLVVDYDAKPRTRWIFDELVRALEDAGVEHLLLDSGNPLEVDRRHVWAHLPRGHRRTEIDALISDLNARAPKALDIRTTAIRPPLSPHRLGGASRILNMSEDEALAFVRSVVEHTEHPAPVRNLGDLPLVLARALRTGDGYESDEGDRSGRDINVVRELLVAAAPDHQIVEWMVHDKSVVGSSKARAKERQKAGAGERYIEGQIKSAREWLTRNPAIC